MSDQPEIGQILFGAPTGDYGTDELGDACTSHVLAEIDRVFWNRNQKQWDRHEDPKIPGVEFRPYNWDEGDPNRDAPNLCLAGDNQVEIRWYKHPMRGGSVNRKMAPADWYDWLNQVLAVIRAADVAL